MADFSSTVCVIAKDDGNEFWTHPLGKWVQSWLDFPGLKWPPQCKQPISYVDLCNAAILNALLLYIDPRETNQNVNPCDTSDVGGRLNNLGTFLRNVQSFYQEVLCQLIVMPLPDLLTIARQPFPEGSGEEMKKVLLLLLGCAVQSDKKEEFIEKIKELELSLQHAIVEQIQRITNNAECVLNVQALELDPEDKVTTTVLHQLQKVVKERNTYAQTVLELSQEQESDSSSGGSLCNGDVCSRKLPEALQHDARSLSPTATGERNHLAVELADAKAKFRKARNEVEEKVEQIAELRDDLGLKENEITRLQQEKIDLLREARSAKDYRDELDCLQQKVAKLDRMETENSKLREKLSELEFFRSRVEELRQENHILLETRQVLEDQLESWKQKSQHQTEAESKLLESQRTMHDLQTELRQQQDRMSELVEENARLEKECHSGFEKCSILEREIEGIRNPSTPRANQGSLGDQLNDSVHKKLLELELENQKLRSQADNQRNSESTKETANALIQEMHIENDALRAKIEELKKQTIKDSKNSIEFQEDKEQLVKQRLELEKNFSKLESEYKKELEWERTKSKELEQSLSELKTKFSDFQGDTYKKLQSEFDRKCDSVRDELNTVRSQKDDVLRENRSFSSQITRLKSELAESDQRALTVEEERLKLENRVHALDRENRCLDKEKLVLKEKLDGADTEFEGARTRLVELERDRQRLENLERRLETANSQLADSELEQKQLIQQVDLETKKTSRLREDLISERTKCGDLIARIQSAATVMGLSGLSLSGADLSSLDTQLIEKWQTTQKELADLKNRTKGKDNNLDELRSQLARHKTELHGYRIKEKEKLTKLNSSDSETSADSRKLEDLEVENRNIKEQVGILQERIRHLTSQLQLKENENTAHRQELSDLKIHMSSQQSLQTDNTKLQVALRNLELQEDLMRSDNEELQKQCSNLEQQNQSLRRDFEQLQKLHTDLLTDHEQLQMLHEQLSMDYEAARKENSELKIRYRELKGREGALEEIREKTEKDRRKVEELKAMLSEERSQKDREFRSFALLQNEHAELKRSYDELQCKCEVLKHDVDKFSSDGRGMKNDYQESRLKVAQLQGQLSDLQELLQRKDLETHKLIHKCEMMSQLNSTLEEESKTLLRQMDTLIIQNQDLLQQTLMDKEHYHAEEKELTEKMNTLKRHKEKLEEKIMDQYKTMDSPNKRKDGILQKAARVFNGKPNSRKSLGQKGASSGDDASSNLSNEDGGFAQYRSLTLPNGETAVCSSHSESGKRSNRARNRASSSDELERKHSILDRKASSSIEDLMTTSLPNGKSTSHTRSSSNSTQAESSLSTGTRSSDPPTSNEHSPNSSAMPKTGKARVSWAGSERAVDVPGAPSPPNSMPPPCPPQYMNQQRTPPFPVNGLPPRCPVPSVQNTPPLPPPRKYVVAFRPPPPPYPAKPVSVPNGGTTLRPPPPPYRGKQHGDLNRFRPDLMVESGMMSPPNNRRASSTPNQSEGFSPQKTSTPIGERNFSFSVVNGATSSSSSNENHSEKLSSFHPGNNSLASATENERQKAKFPLEEINNSNSVMRRNGTKSTGENDGKRRHVVSLYENLENLSSDCVANENEETTVCRENPIVLAEISATDSELLVPDDEKKERDSTIWYEYGCV